MGIGEERGVQNRVARFLLEDLREQAVGGGLGQVDAVKTHASFEATRQAQIERDDARRGVAFEQPLREARSGEGTKASDREAPAPKLWLSPGGHDDIVSSIRRSVSIAAMLRA